MKIKNKTVLIIDGESDVVRNLIMYLRTQNNKIVLFGSGEHKQRAVAQGIQAFNYVVGAVSDQESIQKLYDYFGKGFQAIDVIIQVKNRERNSVSGFESLNHRATVAGNAIDTNKEWAKDLISPENLQEYFVPIMLKEREAQVITIFRENRKRNPRFILPYLGLKSYSSLYSRTVRHILCSTHIKVTDVFIPDSEVTERGLKKMIEALEKGKNCVYL